MKGAELPMDIVLPTHDDIDLCVRKAQWIGFGPGLGEQPLTQRVLQRVRQFEVAGVSAAAKVPICLVAVGLLEFEIEMGAGSFAHAIHESDDDVRCPVHVLLAREGVIGNRGDLDDRRTAGEQIAAMQVRTAARQSRFDGEIGDVANAPQQGELDFGGERCLSIDVLKARVQIGGLRGGQARAKIVEHRLKSAAGEDRH
jgi:hypothetical protein